ncbi:MAG: hypothetical protein NUK57_04445 [Gudongella sp.]|nr:hypothetical protein [Gudongella sp.]
MFAGTQIWFKLLYFYTAMVPAYVLFCIQLSDKYPCLEKNLLIILILIIILSGCITAKFVISRLRDTLGVGYTTDFNPDNIKVKKNGEVLSFLLGVILPSVFIFSNNLIITIVVFITIHLMIYQIIVRSSNIIPNVILMFMGMDTYEITTFEDYEPEFIITIGKHDLEDGVITRIGNDPLCRTYILGRVD